MWMKILTGFRRGGYAVMVMMLLLNTSSCNNIPQKQRTESDEVRQVSAQDEEEDDNEFIKIYCDIYKRAVESHKPLDLNVIQDIIDQLGKRGYTAIDSRNQVDMTGADRAIQFCERAEDKKISSLTVIEVAWTGGLVKYDLETRDGNIDVNRKYYEYDNGSLKKMSDDSYPAESWKYTEEGYFMFSGVLTSEKVHIAMGEMEEMEEHTAFRVQPLDEKCWELSRKYLLPISYEHNNMFLVNWSEEDFGELNFYDMFEIFYQDVTGQQTPYTEADDAGTGKVYRVPENEFESVVKEHFNIDSETLRSKTIYYPEDKTYEFKPRGFWEIESPEHPYPEVVKYTKNKNGTITLLVHAVYPFTDNPKVFAHEVVIRLLEGGGVQYVSNYRLPSEYSDEVTWHVPRLTGEEWDEVYR